MNNEIENKLMEIIEHFMLEMFYNEGTGQIETSGGINPNRHFRSMLESVIKKQDEDAELPQIYGDDFIKKYMTFEEFYKLEEKANKDAFYSKRKYIAEEVEKFCYHIKMFSKEFNPEQYELLKHLTMNFASKYAYKFHDEIVKRD